ncbi:aspartate aminotransferase family protein [Bacillus aquiflavi]|uniref:aminotransferase family protein n=1 Tax=Bacillus aquiflavi TaxID=2672567 RepID=UPI001CA9AD0B|nr:aspartate aminotransferase family protein [Bacillus aquiflavi]UAC48860.1 aspartate aminotransferase family protein [Bacillus aquiflavi]
MIGQQANVKKLIELDKKHFIHPTSSLKQQQENGPAVIFREGQGAVLTDINGKTYLDGMASLFNVNVGYGRVELAEAAKEQMAQLVYSSCFATYSNEPAIELAAKLAEMTPGNLNAVFFTSGGSESNDTAYKLVRHYWQLKGYPNKNKIISRKKAYHGVTVGSTSATGIPVFRSMTTALAPQFFHAETFSPESVQAMIEREGADTIAAFIAEPVQGASGVNIAPDGYFQEIRRICDEYNILFIADEVITGFGRTGKMFGCEHWGVTPDVMLLAKGITSGYFPLGAVVVTDKIHQDLIDLSEGVFPHGFTYSGHATGCTVALKNLEIIERENIVANSQRMGEELLKGLKALQLEFDIVGEVRALGLIGALEFVKDKLTNERFSTPLAPLVKEEAMNRGLILRDVAFPGDDTVIFAPPLIINKYEVEQMIAILRQSIIEVGRQLV